MEISNSKIAGALFFVASAQFVIGLVAAEALYPGYRIYENYISDLGVGPSSMIFNSSVFLFGFLSIIGTYFLPRTISFSGPAVLLTIMSVGAMGVGIFTSAFTTVHAVVSLMTFMFGALSAIASSKVSKIPLSAISVILGMLTLGALGLFAAGLVTTGSWNSSIPPVSEFFLGIGPGGIERMIIYPAVIWLILFSGHLMASSTETRHRQK